MSAVFERGVDWKPLSLDSSIKGCLHMRMGFVVGTSFRMNHQGRSMSAVFFMMCFRSEISMRITVAGLFMVDPVITMVLMMFMMMVVVQGIVSVMTGMMSHMSGSFMVVFLVMDLMTRSMLRMLLMMIDPNGTDYSFHVGLMTRSVSLFFVHGLTHGNNHLFMNISGLWRIDGHGLRFIIGGLWLLVDLWRKWFGNYMDFGLVVLSSITISTHGFGSRMDLGGIRSWFRMVWFWLVMNDGLGVIWLRFMMNDGLGVIWLRFVMNDGLGVVG